MTRRESRNVFSENPAVFMQDLQQAIHDGFRVSNSNEGYPMLNSILKEVRVYRSDDSFTAPMPDDVTSQYVAEWDGMRYLLSFQNLVLQGFEVDTNSVSFSGMKTAKMVRVHKADEDAIQDAALADLQGNAQSTETEEPAEVQFRTEAQSEEEEEMAAPEKPEPTSPAEELAQEGTATTALNPEPNVDNDNRVEDQKLPEEELADQETVKTTRRRKSTKK